MGASESPLESWLGKLVPVVIDRPLGSLHPLHPDIVHPINYGYIPTTVAGDLEPIDACVLELEVPVSSFIGEVVGVVVRHDDAEGKLVVAPAGRRYSIAEIEAAIRFQEQYCDSEIRALS